MVYSGRFIPGRSLVRIRPPLPKQGPLVKRSRHRPFTAVTRVRFSQGSPNGELAQLGEHLPYKQGVTGSSPVLPTTKNTVKTVFFCYILLVFCFDLIKSSIFRQNRCTNRCTFCPVFSFFFRSDLPQRFLRLLFEGSLSNGCTFSLLW